MDATAAVTATATATPFSALIRAASMEQHGTASTSTFMSDLLGGRHAVGAFARYTAQLWFVYQALEESAETLKDDPVAGPFVLPALFRTARIESDLAHMLGDDWRAALVALPETTAYADRIKECARTWPAGYIAHHYTRYLGDLAGGQAIRDRAERSWGFSRKGEGVQFYVFDQITNPAAFRREYRVLLDAVDADELERQRIVEECRRAYEYNSAVFAALGEEFPLAAA
ncbi:biliverdin-producing heme oxygenase [Streptomyces yaizuensis]|uniref:Biliverdin-producing heme oxygenase n=1 Tax=Streptomyces yaizuensis TaxID=2989713 RepID=A0ABQ5NUE1_9ACTN|nr:biliverdin-producing heme oxygenase [Streptomyces sp. YSPA8]GLF93979.1 biliverdin-producing heme oxygenase [Streptomyces sp. YSPA8]